VCKAGYRFFLNSLPRDTSKLKGHSTMQGGFIQAKGLTGGGGNVGTVGTHKHRHPLFSFPLPSHAQTCNVFR
jgi:hypothetical protein